MDKESCKKLAIFIPSLSGGGAERAMIAVANGLAESHLVDLVVSDAKGAYKDEVSKNVNIIDFKSSRLLYSLLKLRNYIVTQRPTTLLSVLTTANILSICSRFLSRSKCRLILSERASISAALSDNSSWQAKLLPFLIQKLYNYSDMIVSVSEGISKELISNFGINSEKSIVIHNPVVNDFLIKKSNEPLENIYFDHKNIPMVLGVGRLTSQKNFSLLIKSFAIVREKIEAKLVILGEGPLREELKQLSKDLRIEKDVHLPGFVDNPFAWMKNSKVFVLSSNYEGLPNALIQAMACGTQVISTNCPTGPDEILEGGKWGGLVDVGDLEGLSREVLVALKKNDLKDSVSRANYFSQDRAIELYEQLLF